MPSPYTPLTVTITFSPTPDGANVRWEAEVLGVRSSRFTSPYQGSDLALVIQALDILQDLHYPGASTAAQQRHLAFASAEQARLARLGLWSEEGRIVADAPRRVGQALYQALTADAAGELALGTVRDYATASNRPVALSLRFPADNVELAALPWELLWDNGPVPLLFSRGSSATCTRHLDLAQALPPPRDATGPLRILAIVPHASVPAELRLVEHAIRYVAWKSLIDKGLAVMEEISPATRLGLFRVLQGATPPDIIHFYGHTRYINGSGALLLDRPDGEQVWVNTDTLATLAGGVHMFVLQDCRGAMMGRDNPADQMPDLALRTGIAPALSAAGVPIVLAMQFSMRTQAAMRASAVIYRALALGQSVQQAISQARQLLYIAENNQASWYVPVLYIRSADPGPVYLLHRAQPDMPETLKPEQGATQAITAHSYGQIQAVRMYGSAGAHQHVAASQGGQINAASLRAQHASRQQLNVSDQGCINDVHLDDQAGKVEK